jgi:hypothetical protein
VETVITYLEMHSPSELRPKRAEDLRFSIGKQSVPQWKFNRFLYGFIGEGWNWTDKNVWTDEQWRAYAESPNLQTFVAYYDGSIAGYFEIERRKEKRLRLRISGSRASFSGVVSAAHY